MNQSAVAQGAEAAEAFSYDVVPYESYSYTQSHPPHLATIAKVFGLEAPDFTTARVLELGAASGGNLMPLAHDFPEARFTGIDLSAEQILAGQKQVEQLGLKNLRLEQMDIMDVTARLKDEGPYDYIICHGVFSWVPEHVQEEILRSAQEMLSPNGLAVISYNTMPGWAMVRAVRDMMLFHTKRFEDPSEKIKQAKILVKFLHENTKKGDPFHSALENELKLLASTNESYVMHEYLESENQQFYFHEFYKKARTHKLNYIGDSNLTTMYVGNLPEKAAEQLRAVGDIITQEQYMDFLRNRRFRWTILGRDSLVPDRNLQKTFIHNFLVESNLECTTANPDLHQNLHFRDRSKPALNLDTKDPPSSALFLALADNAGNPVSTDELVEQAAAMDPAITPESVRKMIETLGHKLVFGGFLQLSLERARHVREPGEKPEVYKPARVQAEHPGAGWVTNIRRSKTLISPVIRHLILLLDGTRTRDQVIAALADKFGQKQILLDTDPGLKEMATAKSDEELAREIYDTFLPRLASRCLLAA